MKFRKTEAEYFSPEGLTRFRLGEVICQSGRKFLVQRAYGHLAELPGGGIWMVNLLHVYGDYQAD